MQIKKIIFGNSFQKRYSFILQNYIIFELYKNKFHLLDKENYNKYKHSLKEKYMIYEEQVIAASDIPKNKFKVLFDDIFAVQYLNTIK